MKVTALFTVALLFAIILAEPTNRLGDLFTANLQGIKQMNIEYQIRIGETHINTTGEQYYRTLVYKSQHGSISFTVLKKDASIVQSYDRTSQYVRVVKGKLNIRSSQDSVSVFPRDGVLLSGDHGWYRVENSENGFTSYFTLNAPHKLTQNEVQEFSSKNITRMTSSPSKSTLDLGKFLVFGSSPVDLNEMATRLIARGERLVSAPIAINKGISVTMFVLRGISGCHKHMRSDYIAWNALGGSLQHIKHPLKFDSNLNDPAIMPIEYVHNLFSHKSNDVNVMILLQFPAQTSNDSQGATGCMEP